jgi:hypothetical protein
MTGVWTRLKLAFQAFFLILLKGRLPAALESAGAGPVPDRAPAQPLAARDETGPLAARDQTDRAVQMMALLQRDGRLVDFLMEDLGSYSDGQIGAAVRNVHEGCRRVLDRYFTLESIVTGHEGESTTVVDPIDPAAVRLVGNAAGHPPFQGVLLHRGWRASRVDLPPLGPPASRAVVAQAEIEVG